MQSSEETILCPNCDQNIEASKYFLHERMCSLNVKKCPTCNKPFNVDELNEHIKLEHSYVICDLCNIKFPNSIMEEHKKNCLCRLVPCKYCELNVLFKELEEHEDICGSTTQECSKCGLYIEKKNLAKHICLNKETEFLNENIKIDYGEDEKLEKKKIKYGLKKNSYNQKKVMINIDADKNMKEENKLKANEIFRNDDNLDFQNTKKKNKTKKNKKKQNNINIDSNEIMDNIDIDMNMIYTPEEIQNQINAFNKFENMNKINNNNININNKQKKKKKKNKKFKEINLEESGKQDEIKNKKGKKIKIPHGGGKNNKNINKDEEEDNKYFDEDEYYTGKKNINLHNLKWDIPSDKYKNYNNIPNNYYDYGLDYNLEDNLLEEAIQRSLKEQ